MFTSLLCMNACICAVQNFAQLGNFIVLEKSDLSPKHKCLFCAVFSSKSSVEVHTVKS